MGRREDGKKATVATAIPAVAATVAAGERIKNRRSIAKVLESREASK